MENTEEWLEAWADSAQQVPGYEEEKRAFKATATACIEDAKREGISEKALLDAAGGDLEQYLMDHQNAITDAEVHRLAAEDD